MDNNYGNQSQSVFGQSGAGQLILPNATAVLVLGILSIVCCCGNVIGVICGIIALVLAKKDFALYHANPLAYKESSFKNLNAGRICAIIGLVLSSISLINFIIRLIMFGTVIFTNPTLWRMR